MTNCELSRTMRVESVMFHNVKGYFISLNMNEAKDTDEIFNLYGNACRFCSENRISVVYEKVFGRLQSKDSFIACRKTLLEKLCAKESPLTYIEGTPVTSSAISCVNMFAVKQDSEKYEVEYGKTDRGTISTTIKSKDDGFKMLYIGNISGKSDDSMEIKSLFDYVKRLIAENDFRHTMIVRTWFYLDRITENYRIFNDYRNEFFEDCGINIGGDSEELPASTCIEGKSELNSIVNMNLLLMETGGNYVRRKRVFNRNQNEADGQKYLYNPAFSRAVSILSDQRQIVYVSGTASIGVSGQVLGIDDDYLQIKMTILNIKNILDQSIATFRDLHHVICFFKHRKYYESYLKVLEELGIDDFSNGVLISNVCRDDLLFEMDGIIIK